MEQSSKKNLIKNFNFWYILWTQFTNIYSQFSAIYKVNIESLTVEVLYRHNVYLEVGIIWASESLLQRDHSSCTAVIGCTAWALRIVEAEASDRPTYFIFPSSTNFFSSPICIKGKLICLLSDFFCFARPR